MKCAWCDADAPWPALPAPEVLCVECHTAWSQTLGGRSFELGRRFQAVMDELRVEHRLVWVLFQLKMLPYNLKRGLSKLLPCRVFGHKFEDSLSRVSKRCIRCGKVEMGDPLKGLLKRMWF